MRIQCSVGTNKIGSETTGVINIDDAELECKNKDEITEICENAYLTWMYGHIETDWHVLT